MWFSSLLDRRNLNALVVWRDAINRSPHSSNMLNQESILCVCVSVLWTMRLYTRRCDLKLVSRWVLMIGKGPGVYISAQWMCLGFWGFRGLLFYEGFLLIRDVMLLSKWRCTNPYSPGTTYYSQGFIWPDTVAFVKIYFWTIMNLGLLTLRMQLVITKLKVGSSSDIIFCVKMKLLISRINWFYIFQLNLTAIN